MNKYDSNISMSFATEKVGGLLQQSSSAAQLSSQQFVQKKAEKNTDLQGNLEIHDISLQKEIETLKKVKQLSIVETPQIRQNLIRFMKKDYKWSIKYYNFQIKNIII